MFTDFYFQDFKSFRKSSIPIEPVTLIIGANASGKSNALEGIKVLSRLSKPLEIRDILDGIRGQLSGIRGGSRGAALIGTTKFGLSCNILFNNILYIYTVYIQTHPNLYIETERLECKRESELVETWLDIKHDETVCDSQNEESSNSLAGVGKDISHLSQELMYKEIKDKGGSNLTGKLDACQAIADTFEKIFIFDPTPDLMKEYVDKNKTRLLPNGENLSAVMGKLIKKTEVKNEILNLLQDFPEQRIMDIKIIQTPTDDVMLNIVEQIGQREVSFDVRGLSDGTLRYMAIIAALFSEPEGTTLILEEIDNGLHPNRVSKLMDFLSKKSRERNIDVIATTHNPALLNSVSKADIPGVVVCYRDINEGDSRFVRWIDIPSYPELMAKGRIGDLLTKGLVEKATHETDEERNRKKKVKLEWIKEEFK